MDKPWQSSKPVRLSVIEPQPTSQWQQVRDLTDELKHERSSNPSMADVIMEAVTFFRDNRPKPNLAGTPDVPGADKRSSY
jgi:hypothetical protein